MTIEALKNSTEYTVHHTASRRGYESRRADGHIEAYKGKFGEGFIHVQPRFDTTQYVFVTYYIKK